MDTLNLIAQTPQPGDTGVSFITLVFGLAAPIALAGYGIKAYLDKRRMDALRKRWADAEMARAAQRARGS